MGVPLSTQFAKTDEERQVLELIQSQSTFGRPYILPPGVPADRVAALRKAFVAGAARSGAARRSEENGSRLDEMSGEDLQALIAKLYALPPNIIVRAKTALVYTPPHLSAGEPRRTWRERPRLTCADGG